MGGDGSATMGWRWARGLEGNWADTEWLEAARDVVVDL